MGGCFSCCPCDCCCCDDSPSYSYSKIPNALDDAKRTRTTVRQPSSLPRLQEQSRPVEQICIARSASASGKRIQDTSWLRDSADPLRDYVQRYLEPDECYSRCVSYEINKLATFLKEQCRMFSIAEVFKGGSVKKQTDVRGLSDLDVIVFINDFSDMDELIKNFHPVLDELQNAIESWQERDNVGVFFVSRSSHALKVRAHLPKAGWILVDILPANMHLKKRIAENRFEVYEEMDRSECERSFYGCSFAPLQCDWVRHKTGNSRDVRNLIRLVKYWKSQYLQQHISGKVPSSYLLEVLTIHTVAESPAGFRIEDAFQRILYKLANYGNINYGCYDYHNRRDYVEAPLKKKGVPFIVDPADPFNNLCDRFYCWEEVSRIAADWYSEPGGTVRRLTSQYR